MEKICLTKVVLAKPQSIETNSLAEMLKTAVGRYCVSAVCQEHLVVEADDELIKKDGLEQLTSVRVVDCEPVDKGILNSFTEVRVMNIVEEKMRVSRSRVDSLDRKEVSELDSFDSAVFQSSSLGRENLLSLPCLLKPSRIYGLTKMMKRHLKDIGIKADDCHVVGLSDKTLRKLYLSEGSWIVIRASTDECQLQSAAMAEEEPVSVERAEYIEQAGHMPSTYDMAIMQDEPASKHFVQVFSIQKFLPSRDQAEKRSLSRSTKAMTRMSHDAVSSDDDIYLNPYLYFNMTTDYPAILDDFNVLVERAETVVPEEARVCPPTAKELHYMRVLAQNSSGSINYLEPIKAFFKTPRLLNEGDVFCVPLVERNSIYTNAQHHAGNLIYFQVQTIRPCAPGFTSFFVDSECIFKAETKPTYSYIPVSMDCYLCPPENESWSCFDPPDLWHDDEPEGLEDTVHKIRGLILPSMLQIVDSMPIHCNILVTGPVGVGIGTVVKAIARGLNMHLIQADCYEYCCDTAAAAESKLNSLFALASQCAPCVLLLSHFEALGKDKTGLIDEPRVATVLEGKLKELKRCRRWPVVVIAASCNPKAIPIDMHCLFLHEVKMEAPDFHERGFMLVDLSSRVPLHKDVSLTELAHHTAGMVLGDLSALYSHATRIAYHRVVKESTPSLSYSDELECSHEEAICAAGASLRMRDFEDALSILQAAHSDAIGAPKVPTVSWNDVGGLTDAKKEILETIQLPLNHPEWFAKGLTRSGVLLYGPPGCGKTLLAKAVATECSLNFLSVKGPELLNMYVGQSEQNVREVFTRARDARPCVVFFDELDSLAPNRGRSGDSGGVMDRVVSQLLTELDGIDKVQDVFVIGATNRPDLVDPALLRPGRFDRLVYLGVPGTHKAQLSILTALTRKFNMEDKFDLSTFVNSCGMTLTGADLYALCSDAMLNAMKRNIEQYEAGTKEEIDDELLIISENDFRTALENLRPSVTEEDLKLYQEIRQRMTANRHY